MTKIGQIGPVAKIRKTRISAPRKSETAGKFCEELALNAARNAYISEKELEKIFKNIMEHSQQYLLRLSPI